jgi:hypothetical protein
MHKYIYIYKHISIYPYDDDDDGDVKYSKDYNEGGTEFNPIQKCRPAKETQVKESTYK